MTWAGPRGFRVRRWVPSCPAQADPLRSDARPRHVRGRGGARHAWVAVAGAGELV